MIQLPDGGYFKPEDLPNLTSLFTFMGYDPRVQHVFLDAKMIALALNELARRDAAASYASSQKPPWGIP